MDASIIGVIPQYPQHSKHNIYARIRMPPVGIVSVLSQVAHDARFRDVYAIDENNYRGPRDFMGMPDHTFLQERTPIKVALLYGGMSNSIPRTYAVAQQYQKFGAVTVAGGSHVDALPEEALRSGVDIVVHGEGERTIKELLDVIVHNDIHADPHGLATVKGISYLEDGTPTFTGPREPIADLDELVDPDLTIIKYLEKRWTAIPINRGRGCNWNCEFCVVNKQYGKYKASSLEKAVRQIIRYSDMGYKSFFFTDDNFAQEPEAAIELCRMIGDSKRRFGKKMKFTVQIRSEVANDDELLDAMDYAGVTTAAIGFESPINGELKSMRKGVTVDQLVQRSRKLADHFYIHGMFIFGYPTNATSIPLTERAKAYARFFRDGRLDTIQVLNAVPLPGSALRARLEKEGRLLPLEAVGWDKFDGQFLCYDPRPLDPYELQNIPRLLMKQRYLGNFISRRVNYGNWMNWVYTASIGFPIQFSTFYVKRFIHNAIAKKRAHDVAEPEGYFSPPLTKAWKDIKRRWRNLAIKTVAGGIARRWTKVYKRSDYERKLHDLFGQKSESGDRTQ